MLRFRWQYFSHSQKPLFGELGDFSRRAAGSPFREVWRAQFLMVRNLTSTAYLFMTLHGLVVLKIWSFQLYIIIISIFCLHCFKMG